MTYRIVMYAHCGMTVPLAEGLDREQGKAKILQRVRYKRALGFTVERLGRGRWEFTDEACAMIGDDQGILALEPMKKRLNRRRAV